MKKPVSLVTLLLFILASTVISGCTTADEYGVTTATKTSPRLAGAR